MLVIFIHAALLELKKLRGLREWLLLKGGAGSDHGLYDSPWSDCKQGAKLYV